MANQYTWLTLAQARTALAARLADPSMAFWTATELKGYIIESLRFWNALTESWNQEYGFTATYPNVWYNLSLPTNSPRQRTVTDTDEYKIMQYHLLEPSTGSTWTGTSQFSIYDFQQALQRRRDEVIQATGCNMRVLPNLRSTPNVRRIIMPDSTLDTRRARWIPDSTTGQSPNLLNREDNFAWDGFESRRLQQSGMPEAWSVVAGSPLTFDVDVAPNVSGYYEVLGLQSGQNFDLLVPRLMSVPDDWSWLPKWGALADLLGRESEATDRQRADYCFQKFMRMMGIMKQSNWLLLAYVNGVPVDAVSVEEQDGYAVDWELDTGAWPAVVTCSTDLVAACPAATAAAPVGVSVNLVGNAPVPSIDSDYVQVTRDDWDSVLDYAQVLAAFKQGGVDFMSTAEMEHGVIKAAAARNKRNSALGDYVDMLQLQGKRQDVNQPRG